MRESKAPEAQGGNRLTSVKRTVSHMRTEEWVEEWVLAFEDEIGKTPEVSKERFSVRKTALSMVKQFFVHLCAIICGEKL